MQLFCAKWKTATYSNSKLALFRHVDRHKLVIFPRRKEGFLTKDLIMRSQEDRYCSAQDLFQA